MSSQRLATNRGQGDRDADYPTCRGGGPTWADPAILGRSAVCATAGQDRRSPPTRGQSGLKTLPAPPDDRGVRLFAYGTLRQRDVQLATYGRLLDGTADVLAGYRLDPLPITDPEVVRLSGKAVHKIARATGDPADRIAGIVFTLTSDELEACDRYEVDAYRRVEAMLESGARAFIYVGPELK